MMQRVARSQLSAVHAFGMRLRPPPVVGRSAIRMAARSETHTTKTRACVCLSQRNEVSANGAGVRDLQVWTVQPLHLLSQLQHQLFLGLPFANESTDLPNSPANTNATAALCSTLSAVPANNTDSKMLKNFRVVHTMLVTSVPKLATA